MMTEGTERPPLIRAMLHGEAYPEPVTDVSLLETHVSYLFFTDDHVYKVKKPVSLGFLDFSTLDRRYHYCLEEVTLNGRISPEVYEGVVPIRERRGRYRVEGPGTTVEYAVKMHRLPEDGSLSHLISNDLLQEEDVRNIARVTADFHRRAATGPEVVRFGDIKVVRENTEENFEQTLEFVGNSIPANQYDDLVEYSRAFLDAKARIFESRAAEGRVREGHGDLHADNIFLVDGVKIIDCIEFNHRFRCLDVAEDIAFLATDLDFHGYPDLSDEFVSSYVEESGDHGLWELLDFFKAYRAYVRGKVASFRLDDPALIAEERKNLFDQAKSYFALAHSYAQAFSRPNMVLVIGLMGSGKTHVAEELARRWSMVHISSDVTRKTLAGLDP